jgi:signal transduction histidine kinase
MLTNGYEADYNRTLGMGPANHLRSKLRPKSRSIFLISVTFSLALVCSSLFAIDPHQSLTELYHSSWSEKQGISGHVTALAQTADGYLWVGTTDGLLRFDGISFEQFQPENSSLIGTYVSVLLAVPDGGLWVGFDRGGASFIKVGRVTNYSDSDGFPVGAVRSLARDESGSIWAAAVGGFAHLEGQRWVTIRRDWNYPSKSAWDLLVDREGTLWVATGSQILFLPNGKRQFRETGIHTGKVWGLTQAPDGAIWFSDNARKVRAFRHDGGDKIELLPDVDIDTFGIIFDRDGGLWIGGTIDDDGVSRIPFPAKLSNSRLKEVVETFNQAKGLSDWNALCLLEDREGNVWIGTEGGLDRFRPRNIRWFSVRPGFVALLASGDDVWAGSGEDNPMVQLAGQNRVLSGGPIRLRTVYRDPDDSTWFAANGSLLHWENERFANIPVPHQAVELSSSAIPPDPIIATAITKDRSGSLWVAFSGSGEFRLKKGIWEFVPILPDHPDWAANFAFTDDADRIWLSYNDRVAFDDHGNIRIFGINEGLAIGDPYVITGRGQEIWVGGESGLSFLQNGRFHTVHRPGGVGFVGVSGIVATRDGGIWLSTAPGIVHIPESEVTKLVQSPEHEVALELFDTISDLPEPIQRRGNVFSSGAIQANDGTLWFAARNGAVQIDPAHVSRNPLPPPVSIRSLVVDGKRYSPFSQPDLPALTKSLQIEYAALSLSIPERVRFRYKLEGWEKEWHEAGSRREAVFTNLGPGKYSFRLIACNNDGVWNETGATLQFNILPAFYQTRWFAFFCLAVAASLVWTAYRYRVGQVTNRLNMQFRERLSERARIAGELHDTLLQSVQGLILHFQRVRNLLPANPAEAVQRLDVALERAEQAIVEGRNAIHDIRSSNVAESDLAKAITTLGDELRLSESEQGSAILNVVVEGTAKTLEPSLHDEVYRIVREGLRNAFSHANAQNIEVEIVFGEKIFRARIRDDGKGIDPDTLNRKEPSRHWGLVGMRERAKRIGGQLNVWSEHKAGTEIELIVPGPIAYVVSSGGNGFRLFRKNKNGKA